MNLEDHLGDIIRKARAMTNASAEAAAAAAGLSAGELAALEDSGKATRKLDFAALGSSIGLHPAKLEGIARGWLPSLKDLSQWRELRQISTTEGGNQVHCYLVWDEATCEAAAFDTGWDAAPVLKLVAEQKLQLKHLF